MWLPCSSKHWGQPWNLLFFILSVQSSFLGRCCLLLVLSLFARKNSGKCPTCHPKTKYGNNITAWSWAAGREEPIKLMNAQEWRGVEFSLYNHRPCGWVGKCCCIALTDVGSIAMTAQGRTCPHPVIEWKPFKDRFSTAEAVTTRFKRHDAP